MLCSKQAASFFFPIFRTQCKMYFFIPSVHPCMHHNYGVISGRHTSADCLWPITLVAGLCSLHLPWTSVGSHQVQCNIRTFEALLRKNVYLFLERWKKSNSTWLRALMQSDCLYSSFFEHYTLWLSARTFQLGLPDENFNKKPNSAEKRPEKGQILFVALLFLCHIGTSKLQEYH